MPVPARGVEGEFAISGKLQLVSVRGQTFHHLPQLLEDATQLPRKVTPLFRFRD